ncbi:MAG: hypothetical protein OEW00_11725, partial [candidate division Zixibacteria bacterium]|nr:hypothetical protein [candidate division Zixibacteria bacterium]
RMFTCCNYPRYYQSISAVPGGQVDYNYGCPDSSPGMAAFQGDWTPAKFPAGGGPARNLKFDIQG